MQEERRDVPSKELHLYPICEYKGPVPEGEERANVGTAPEQKGGYSPTCKLRNETRSVMKGESKRGLTHVAIEEGQISNSFVATDVTVGQLERVVHWIGGETNAREP